MIEKICGMVGNPILPEIDWSDEQMQILKSCGFNMLQLNIAWDNRPEGEVLNLDDLGEKEIIEFKRRIKMAEKHGMKVMPHFGIPKMEIIDAYNLSVYMKPSCIQKNSTLERNIGMMKRLLEECPQIDDIMFYTYDQHAWICSEFGMCPDCSGVPIYERLPQFIRLLTDEAASVNPNVTMWWQPWELSAGQVYKIVGLLEPDHLGLVMNTAITESYYHNKEELWLKNVADIAYERGIPILGEIQATGSGVGSVPLQSIPCPRFVYQQIKTFDNLPAAIGIKEHFGIAFSKLSVNTLFLAAYFKNPNGSYQEIVEEVAALYGDEISEILLEAWELVARATEFIPFDMTYLLTNIAGYSPNHPWDAPEIQAIHCDTPAWESSRRGFYALTHATEYHPWLLEDCGLRFDEAAKRLYKAHELLKSCEEQATGRIDDLREQISDVRKMSRAVKGQALHMLETLAAYDLRVALFQGRQEKIEQSVIRLDKLLYEDVVNQDEAEDICFQYKAYQEDPVLWVDLHLRQQEKFYIDTHMARVDQRY